MAANTVDTLLATIKSLTEEKQALQFKLDATEQALAWVKPLIDMAHTPNARIGAAIAKIIDRVLRGQYWNAMAVGTELQMALIKAARDAHNEPT